MAYSVVVAPRRRLVREVVATLGSLRHPHTVVFIADLHLRGGQECDLVQLRRFWEELRPTGVDCVLLGGDVVERDDDAGSVAAALRSVFKEVPVLCVLGNHDVDGPDPIIPSKRRHNDLRKIRSAFSARSLTLLEDAVFTLRELTVVGAAWGSHAHATARLSDVVSKIRGPCLVLAHSPDQLVGLGGSDDRVGLCGHTHGGQIDLPWLRWPILFLRNRLPRAAGVMRIGELRTFVTTGWGQTYPVRIRVRPEIVVVRLVPRPPGGVASMTSRVVRT